MSGLVTKLFFRIIVAAFLCAIVKTFTGKSTVVNSIIKTLCSVFLTLSILSPLVSLNFSSLPNYIGDFSADADQFVEAGIRLSENSLRDSIKQQAEAYIEDKAASLNAELTVEVTLNDDEIPAPCSVKMEGRISPYAKSTLQCFISDNLGIQKENQIWI